MHVLSAHIRNGRIELDGPLPPNWSEGQRVSLTITEPTEPLDITGDSPEAIAAWLKWYEEFRALPRDEAAAEEMDKILISRKAELKAQWEHLTRCGRFRR
jgi:hypothetical protein